MGSLRHIMWHWCDMWQIPQSSEGKAWYSYVDPNVTAVILEGEVILWFRLTLLTRDDSLWACCWNMCGVAGKLLQTQDLWRSVQKFMLLTTISCHYFTFGSLRSIVISLSICMYVHPSQKPHDWQTNTSVLRPSGPCPGLPRWASTTTNLDFTQARDSEWQWHQLDHRQMQICTSPQTDNCTSSPPLSFLQARCPSCSSNSIKTLKAVDQTSPTYWCMLPVDKVQH